MFTQNIMEDTILPNKQHVDLVIFNDDDILHKYYLVQKQALAEYTKKMEDNDKILLQYLTSTHKNKYGTHH